MVTAEVREHRNLELQCLDAFHGDCVRRDFHYGVFPSRIDHLSEEFFQFGRLRCCPFRWESESCAPIFDRAKCGGGTFAAFKMDSTKYVVVVFPLVPVIPMRCSWAVG